MPQLTSIRDLYHIDTDATDWPKGLPDDEKEVLKVAVLDALDLCRPLCTYDLYQRVKSHADVVKFAPVFKKAAMLDWLYGCVVRAARAADCEQRWHPPEKCVPPETKPPTFTDEETAALNEAARVLGRRWKSRLRLAWETGDYGVLRGTSTKSVLQQIRNEHGSKALDKFKPAKPKTACRACNGEPGGHSTECENAPWNKK